MQISAIIVYRISQFLPAQFQRSMSFTFNNKSSHSGTFKAAQTSQLFMNTERTINQELVSLPTGNLVISSISSTSQ